MEDSSRTDDRAMNDAWLTPETAILRAREKCSEIDSIIDKHRSQPVTIYPSSISDRSVITDESQIRDGQNAITSLKAQPSLFFWSIDVKGLDGSPTWYVSDAPLLGGFLHEAKLVSWTHPVGGMAIRLKNCLARGETPKTMERTWGKKKTNSETHEVGPLVEYTFQNGEVHQATFVSPASVQCDEVEEDEGTADGQPVSDAFALRSLIRELDLDQNSEIRGPMTGVFVLTGGPGVGKTSIGLHRIPYLINEQPEGSFFRADNQLVIVWKEHLVRYLRELAQGLAGGFREQNVCHVDMWTTNLIRDYVQIGGRGGWSLKKNSEVVESWKQNLTEVDLEDVLDGEFQPLLGILDELQNSLPSQSDLQVTSYDPDPRRNLPGIDLSVHHLPLSVTAFQSRSAQILGQIPKGSDLARFSDMQQEKLRALRDRIRNAFTRATQRTSDYTNFLFEFYVHPEVVDMLNEEFEDFDEGLYLDSVARQKADKTLSHSDVCMLLWLIQFVTDGSNATEGTGRALPRYSHILVDEAQYYDTRLLRLFKCLVEHEDRDGVLTIVGDIEQKISTRGGVMKWDDLDLDLEPEQIRRLTTNYRWSREVFDFIECLHAVLDIEEPLKRPARYRVKGGRPAEIICRSSIQELFEIAVDRLVAIKDNARTRSWRIVLVFPNSYAGFGQDSIEHLKSVGLVSRWAEGEDVNNSVDKVILTTSDHIVGLEFDAIFLMGLCIPDVAEIPDDERASLWVAATRPRRFVFAGQLPGDSVLSDPIFDKYRISE